MPEHRYPVERSDAELLPQANLSAAFVAVVFGSQPMMYGDD